MFERNSIGSGRSEDPNLSGIPLSFQLNPEHARRPELNPSIGRNGKFQERAVPQSGEDLDSEVAGYIRPQIDLIGELDLLIEEIGMAFEQNLAGRSRIGFLQPPSAEINIAGLQSLLEAKCSSFQNCAVSSNSEEFENAPYLMVTGERISNFIDFVREESVNGVIRGAARPEILGSLLELRAHLVGIRTEFVQNAIVQEIEAERTRAAGQLRMTGTTEGDPLMQLEPEGQISRELASAHRVLNNPEQDITSRAKDLLRAMLEYELGQPGSERIGFSAVAAVSRSSDLGKLLEQLNHAAELFAQDYVDFEGGTLVDCQHQIFAFNCKNVVDHLRLGLVSNGAGESTEVPATKESFEMIRQAKSQLFRNLAQIEQYRNQLGESGAV